MERNTDERDAIWEILPWYVNGTLDASETRRVEAYIETCPLCAAEVREQRRLAEELAQIGPAEALQARNWAELRARIAAEVPEEAAVAAVPPAGPGAGPGGQRGPIQALKAAIDAALQRFSQRMMVATMGAGVAVAALLLALTGVFAPQTDPAEAPFLTLSPEDAAYATPVLRVRMGEGMSQERASEIATRYGLTIEDGPSATGIYTLRATEPDADLDALATALEDEAGVLFATPRRQR